jgi:hypothetical protein
VPEDEQVPEDKANPLTEDCAVAAVKFTLTMTKKQKQQQQHQQ